MFQKNIAAIKQKNPDLAKRLENISIDKIQDIEVHEAESKDLILSYKNTALHSTLDPIREAKSVWNRTITRETAKNDILVVFGLGIGYLFKRAFINSESKVFIYEPFIEVLRFVLEYVDFSAELAQDRVYLTDNAVDIISKIDTVYLSGDRIEFLFLNSYAALGNDLLSDLVEKTLTICTSKIADQNTIFNMCGSWTMNSILNISALSKARPAGYLENSFKDKPCLLISAGPSLKKNLDAIKANKDKFVTVAVAPAYKVLVEAGIVPDFVAYAEHDNFAKYVDGAEQSLEKINVVMGTRADNNIFSYNTASKILYFSDIDPIAIDIQKSMQDNVGLYKSGGTVSILSYYFAKALGCNPIVCAGLDLAFVDNMIYADGREFKINDEGQINAVCPGMDNETYNKKVIYIKSNNEQMIPTRDDYALFVRQFEDIMTNEVNPRVINTSVNGAFINGMEYMDFDSAIKLLNTQEISVNSIIAEMFNTTQEQWSKSSSVAVQKLSEFRVKAAEIKSRSKNITGQIIDITSSCDYKEKTDEFLQRINALKGDFIALRNEVINDPYIANYLQPHIWSYTQAYKTSPIPDIEEIVFNINLESAFFTQVNIALEKIVNWVDQALEKSTAEV
jgi:hypothetical protein